MTRLTRVLVLVLAAAIVCAAGLGSEPAAASGGPAILTLRQQAAVYNDWLKNRLDRLLPDLMRQEGFDMWLVICRENNEDPVYASLVPFNTLYASRTSMLVFFDRGAEGVERLTVSRSGIGGLYKSVWEPEKVEQWTRLAQVIKERNPKRIGVNRSEIDAYGDGLTATMERKLMTALPSDYSARVASAERLAVRWLGRRSSEQIETYPQVVAVAHAIIAEAFSNAVITPGVTTTDDVAWWMRERSRELGLTNWFHATVDVQRPKDSPYKDSQVIHRGDFLHCDFGITYLRLCTDTQQVAYVLREGETDAPKGLRDGLAAGNRLQDIHLAEMRVGRTGNEILSSALKLAKAEGLRPSVYTHPLGVHGHAAGPLVGMWDMQNGVPGVGDYRFDEDTVHSIELNVTVTVPEWGNQDVRMPLEQDAVVTKTGARFLDKRQTTMILIR